MSKTILLQKKNISVVQVSFSFTLLTVKTVTFKQFSLAEMNSLLLFNLLRRPYQCCIAMIQLYIYVYMWKHSQQ